MATKKETKTKKTAPLQVCIDRPVTLLNAPRRMLHSVQHNTENIPAQRGTAEHDLVTRFAADPHHSFNPDEAATLARMAIVTASKWQKGTTITISFLDGSATQKAQVKKMAAKWLPFVDLKFKYLPTKKGMIRISFKHDDGSWSYIGTECLSISLNEPTMNFGWLRNDTPDEEWERVVVHEFGHALGCIHEHQNPAGGIKWNKPAVYKYYEGPPNNWTKADVDGNLFQKYEKTQTQFTKVDRNSIMMYPIPKEFLLSGEPVGWNLHLSQTDEDFIEETYKGDAAAKPKEAMIAAPRAVATAAAPSDAAPENTTLDTLYIVDDSDNNVTLEITVGDAGQTSDMTIKLDDVIVTSEHAGNFPKTALGSNKNIAGKKLSIVATIADTARTTNFTSLDIHLKGGVLPKDFSLSKTVDSEGASADYLCLIEFFKP